MKARFTIYEIEHHGDEDSALSELQRAGCTNIRITGRDHEGEESFSVECDLPAGMAHFRELEAIADLCL